MKTKRYVGELVRILRNRHPAMKYDLISLMKGGKIGLVESIVEHGGIEVRVGRYVFGCEPNELRGVTDE